ncbi:MAG: Multi-copper polyphenol oxidoreductase laccase [Chlorobi bacterium OLB4]|jgi:conserved hypothetical protein TIGR00726|nr:MAG: Multi-copper polyphenol oxidoreductase laccase [Chlorobi bacterium OLB4]OQY78467.1 MAG: hypothetical protein B6D43_03080 [Ignavibacteriales bacterium UTCHB1]
MTFEKSNSEIKIIISNKFKKYPELIFGMSTTRGGISPEPYGMNLSLSTNDNPEHVLKNREIFFSELGISVENINFQKQVHSAESKYINVPGFAGECDATYTNQPGVFLTVSVADCLPVFLYDPGKKIVAGIHAGWRGTVGEIVKKTIGKLSKEFNCLPDKLIAFMGPCISQDKFEVGEEVGMLFADEVKYFRKGKYFIDIRGDNHRQLLESGVKEENIENNYQCTYSEFSTLHSFRRDGSQSGRMFGVIGMREV